MSSPTAPLPTPEEVAGLSSEDAVRAYALIYTTLQTLAAEFATLEERALEVQGQYNEAMKRERAQMDAVRSVSGTNFWERMLAR